MAGATIAAPAVAREMSAAPDYAQLAEHALEFGRVVPAWLLPVASA